MPLPTPLMKSSMILGACAWPARSLPNCARSSILNPRPPGLTAWKEIPHLWPVITSKLTAKAQTQQYRPALVVARHREAGSPTLLWVLMITSAGNRRWTGDVEIPDLATAGLPAASVVRTAKVATIEASAAGRLGCLPPANRVAVRARVAEVIGAFLAPA